MNLKIANLTAKKIELPKSTIVSRIGETIIDTQSCDLTCNEICKTTNVTNAPTTSNEKHKEEFISKLNINYQRLSDEQRKPLEDHI